MDHLKDLPPVHSDDDLLDRWRLLMGKGGFGRRSLWMVWFDAHGTQLPLVVPIDDVPQRPDGEMLDGLAHIAGLIVRDEAAGGSVALTLSRPGSSVIGDDDRAWARALLDLADRNAIPLRRLHLATADSVRPFAGDDLA